jgi:hypothetical protein
VKANWKLALGVALDLAGLCGAAAKTLSASAIEQLGKKAVDSPRPSVKTA